MRALVLQRPGDPFTLTEVPRPTAAPGQVLVRIKASGVNPLDTKIHAGQAAHAGIFFEDSTSCAVTAQFVRRRQTRGAGADNHN